MPCDMILINWIYFSPKNCRRTFKLCNTIFISAVSHTVAHKTYHIFRWCSSSLSVVRSLVLCVCVCWRLRAHSYRIVQRYDTLACVCLCILPEPDRTSCHLVISCIKWTRSIWSKITFGKFISVPQQHLTLSISIVAVITAYRKKIWENEPTKRMKKKLKMHDWVDESISFEWQFEFTAHQTVNR